MPNLPIPNWVGKTLIGMVYCRFYFDLLWFCQTLSRIDEKMLECFKTKIGRKQAFGAGMIRTLALLAGLVGAGGLSQFPEFSQQYLQRLSGAVDELRIVVENFDRAAQDAGKSRQDALAELEATEFGQNLSRSMTQTMRRYERLNADLISLSVANPIERMAQPWNLSDGDLLTKTWDAYRPAIPVTQDGIMSATLGFVLGWGMVSIGLGALAGLFRRRKSMS